MNAGSNSINENIQQVCETLIYQTYMRLTRTYTDTNISWTKVERKMKTTSSLG